MYYKNYIEANKAAQQLRKQYDANEIMVKVEQSSYGGYSIRLIPIDLMIDVLSNSQPTRHAKDMLECC